MWLKKPVQLAQSRIRPTSNTSHSRNCVRDNTSIIRQRSVWAIAFRTQLVIFAALRRRLPGSVGRIIAAERGRREQWVPAVSALRQCQLIEADFCSAQCQVVLEPATTLPQHHHECATEGFTRLYCSTKCYDCLISNKIKWTILRWMWLFT